MNWDGGLEEKITRRTAPIAQQAPRQKRVRFGWLSLNRLSIKHSFGEAMRAARDTMTIIDEIIGLPCGNPGFRQAYECLRIL